MAVFSGRSVWGGEDLKPNFLITVKIWVAATFYAGGRKLMSLLGVGK